jgi:crossover junction endodeoxyribonuclease RusA
MMKNEMNAVTITLPLPDKVLSPNSTKHWRVKAKAKKSARVSARWNTLHQLMMSGPNDAVVFESYRLVFYWKDKRRHDKDNATGSMKAALDGIADAVGQDDSEWGFDGVKFGEPDKLDPRVEVIFEVKT